MREISSKEYTENIEDVICEHLEEAVVAAWLLIAYRYGIAAAAENADNVRFSFVDGILPSVRDSIIETFEFWGMDVMSDGGDF